MTPWPAHDYRRRGAAAGRDPALVNRALAMAHVVQRAGYPAVLTLGHLARLTDVPYSHLRQLVERRTPDPYRRFVIAKRSGGTRLICVPEMNLARVQRWLVENILRPVLPHPASMAYCKGSDIVKCAQAHCATRWMIKIDLRQFFESISEPQVYRVFRTLGYGALVSFELARLCTRLLPPQAKRYTLARWRAVRSSAIIKDYSSLNIGHLPQGAPTSPMLSNLVMKNTDSELEALAIEEGLVYTRYADDLIFSTNRESFVRADAARVVRSVADVTARAGLRVNPMKTHVVPPGARKIVLGLLVDRERPRLTREFRDRLDMHVHCIETNGWSEHAKRRGFKSVLSMRRHINGVLAYATHVDREWADKYRGRLAAVPAPI